MGWRDIKRAARSTVHQTMKVRAVFLVGGSPEHDSNSGSFSGSASGAAHGLPIVEIRIHEKGTKLGDQAGTSLNSAEMYDVIPSVIFWRAELEALGLEAKRGVILSVTAGEAYYVDVVEPHDQETIKARVTRLDDADSAGLPLPPEV